MYAIDCYVLADLSLRQVYGVAPATPIRGEETEEETVANRLERHQKTERKARRQATSRARTVRDQSMCVELY